MKKISFFATLLMLLGLGMSSCKEDTQPRLSAPTEFVLNTPPAADQLYIFRANDKNQSLYDIEFTVSQPNYGLGCVPDYQVQVAKSKADFDAWDTLISENGNEDPKNPFLGNDGNPLVSTLETIFTTAKMTVTGDVFSGGVNSVYGLTAENYNGEAVPVAVRVHAWLPNANYSSIFSNIIELPQVSSYIPIAGPGEIYLIGQPQGWNISESKMVAVETEIGSKVYHGVFDIPAGQFQFRFYSQLGDWNSWSIGAQDEDNPVDITFTDGKYSGPIFVSAGGGDEKGKGAWQDGSWEGGKVEVVINMNDMTIDMTMFEGNKVYIVGACNGWNIDSDAMALKETEDGSNIFSGTVNIEAGQFTFRFYTALGDWETNSVGAGEPDEDFAISMAGGSYTGPCVDGKGKWADASWAGGDVNITLDLNNYQVTFEKQ